MQSLPENVIRASMTSVGMLHQALTEATIEDGTLRALLILVLAGENVPVQSGSGLGGYDLEQIAAGITEGGVLSSDQDLVRTAARAMLAAVLRVGVQ